MTAGAPSPRTPRLTTALRGLDERVTPLELFFDLVFVLALTQCTALMAHEPTWQGLAKGLLVLAMLWWSWVGYSWLTSVVDPEDDLVRLSIFAAMAAFLVAALCVPHAFGADGLVFAAAFGVVRAAHIALFVLASREDPALRRAVLGLAGSSLLSTSILVAASFTDRWLQGALWALALTIDMGGPVVIDVAGWKLVPAHFAERHGLIVIIALGESVVAIGAGATVGVSAATAAAAVLGMLVAAVLWWLYFDVVALVATQRLVDAEPGRERNSIARDSYSFLHLPMIAGVALVALGLKKSLGHVDAHLHVEVATALFGGTALYLLAHVAFRLRNVHTLNRHRLGVAIACVALIAPATAIPALAALGILTALLVGLVAYERIRFREARTRLRERLLHPLPADEPPPP